MDSAESLEIEYIYSTHCHGQRAIIQMYKHLVGCIINLYSVLCVWEPIISIVSQSFGIHLHYVDLEQWM